MKKFACGLFAVIAIGMWCGSAQALTIFEDNFDSENGGNYQLNYSGFANWDVTDGTVDLIGEGSPRAVKRTALSPCPRSVSWRRAATVPTVLR